MKNERARKREIECERGQTFNRNVLTKTTNDPLSFILEQREKARERANERKKSSFHVKFDHHHSLTFQLKFRYLH